MVCQLIGIELCVSTCIKCRTQEGSVLLLTSFLSFGVSGSGQHRRVKMLFLRVPFKGEQQCGTEKYGAGRQRIPCRLTFRQNWLDASIQLGEENLLNFLEKKNCYYM
jgi:hypothetical protein